jgi:CHASE1-domain containing sensor protein
MRGFKAHSQWVLKVALITLIYYVSAKLGLLLAIPPGYASAIWPASGVALAFLLIYGYSYWPGIFIGSFLINVDLLNTTDLLQNPTSIYLGLIIGFGAVCQATLGSYFIKKYVGFPNDLIDELKVLKFIFLGGFLSCLINASLGIFSLSAFGLIKWNELFFNWWTWYVGDTIGVLIITPLWVLAWNGLNHKETLRRQLTVGLPLVLALIITVLAFIVSNSLEKERLQAEFESHATKLTAAIELNLQKNLEMVYSIESFFLSSEYISLEEFKAFNNGAIKRHSGIQALEWIPKVPHSNRKEFEKYMRANGMPSFAITERSKSGQMTTALERDFYYPATYVEPFDGNEEAIGFDLASNKARLVALNLAIDSGEMTFTERIRLVQEKGKQFGFLAFMPVYQQQVQNNMRSRRKNIRGFALGVFRVKDIIQSAVQNYEISEIDINIVDASVSGKERMLYSTIKDNPYSFLQLNEKDRGSIVTVPIHLGNKKWLFEYRKSNSYLAANRSWQS